MKSTLMGSLLREFRSQVRYLRKDQPDALNAMLVATLERRLVYWSIYLLVGHFAILLASAVQGTQRGPATTAAWSLVLMALLATIIALCRRQFSNNTDAHSLKTVDTRLVTLTVMVFAASACWTAGIYILSPQPANPQGFVVAQRTFVWLTAFGHVLTVVLLATNWKATLLALLPAFYAPALIYLFGQEHSTVSSYWLTGQIVTFIVVSIFLHFDQRRLLSRQLDLENEQRRIAELLTQRKNLLGTISHDLRNPLLTASTRLSLLRGSLNDHERAEKQCVIIAEQLSRIDSLLRSALELSKLEAGQIDAIEREVALRPFMEEVLANVSDQAAQKSIEIKIIAPDFIIRSDKELLFRIVTNLASNAVKYSNKGGKILLGAQRRGAFVRISVVDQGIGVPEEIQEHIFKEHYQADNSERDPNKGFGLGLTIVDGLARLLNHQIELESAVGKGSRFSIYVPFMARLPKEYKAFSPPVNLDVVPQLGGLKVVLIEDTEDTRRAMQDLLYAWNCHVIAGEDYEEVRPLISDAFGESVPDVILSDYRLREQKNGVDMIQRLLTDFPGTPAILYSGEADVMRLQHITDSGIKLVTKSDRSNSDIARELAQILRAKEAAEI